MAVCKAQEILETSWRLPTKERYARHVQRFTQFCHQRDVNPFQSTTKIDLDYLTVYFNTGVGYSSVNTVTSVFIHCNRN